MRPGSLLTNGLRKGRKRAVISKACRAAGPEGRRPLTTEISPAPLPEARWSRVRACEAIFSVKVPANRGGNTTIPTDVHVGIGKNFRVGSGHQAIRSMRHGNRRFVPGGSRLSHNDHGPWFNTAFRSEDERMVETEVGG